MAQRNSNGKVLSGHCFQWASEGRCRFGSNCKYTHGPSSGANPSTSVNGSTNQSGNGICFEWQKHGTCKKGSLCKYKHDKNKGGRKGHSNKTSGSSSSDASDKKRTLERFVAVLSANGTTPAQVAKQISTSPDLWRRAWDELSMLGEKQLLGMVQAVAKIPSSSSLQPPPINGCKQVIELIMKKAKAKGGRDLLNTVEFGHNAVVRLVQFEWEEDKEIVREAILSMIFTMEGILTKMNTAHREVGKKLLAFSEEVEKPWRIKQKRIDYEEDNRADDEEAVQDLHKWRNATIQWLSSPSLFEPCSLPCMKTPGGVGNGVYESLEDYTNVVHKLWMAMTFYDGFAALSPQCRCRKGRDGSLCQQALWPVKQGAGADLRCRSRGCSSMPKYACRVKGHDALCETCDRKARIEIRGPSGHRASTNIYEGIVDRIDNDGRLFVRSFKCRNPPKHAIHWNSTRRLSTPNMVGVVKLKSSNAPLLPHDKIYWGELGLHGPPRIEPRKREEGRLMVNMLSIMEVNLDLFASGDRVVIVDCLTFVPEWIPVLKAIEQQLDTGFAPFDRDGTYLNLCRGKPADISNTILEVSPLSDIKLDSFRELVGHMVQRSTLDPIQQIRRDSKLKSQLEERLYDLVMETTLDKMQLVSFIDSLMNPVHLTMGPPGTGKSYLGVVVVRALILIRDLWRKKNPSLKKPPILVLSYKNHAIDEFLCDLLNADRNLRAPNQLIRIGGSCNDPRLSRYSEGAMSKYQPEVVRCRDDVESLHKLHRKVETVVEESSVFLAYKSEIFLECSSVEDVKKMNKSAYEATEHLAKALRRVKEIQETLDSEKSKKDVAKDKDNTKDDDDENSSKKGAIIQAKAKMGAHTFIRKADTDMSAIGGVDDMVLTPGLAAGVKHYPMMAFEDMLHLWVSGKKPRPQCRFLYKNGAQCTSIARGQSTFPLCDNHCCSFEGCEKGICIGKIYCMQHACHSDDCDDISMPKHQFCERHGCKRCVELNVPSLIAEDDPPYNVCANHPICIAISCLRYTVEGENYCEEHQRRVCKGKTRRGNPCKNPAMSRSQPYCRDHLSQMVLKDPEPSIPSSSSNSGTLEKNSEEKNRFCKATTKKGKPCKGTRMPNSSFCHDHAPLHAEQAVDPLDRSAPKSQQEPMAEAENSSGHSDDVTTKNSNRPRSDARQDQSKDKAAIKSFQKSSIDSLDKGNVEDAKSVGSLSSSSSVQIEAEEAVPIDNVDEAEWEDDNENYQHIRDVFELAFDEEDVLSQDSFQSADDGINSSDQLIPNDQKPEGLETSKLANPSQWTWDMDLNERWSACQEIMSSQGKILMQLKQVIAARFRVARKELHQAKTRASIKVYEERSIIGGTMVGCVSRLEAIRSTRPFAILVEEASEVLEPLVFSCISESTMKLELIGDHRQLQPSIQNRFDFEIVNKVNVSMFQRLIEAPEQHQVPSTILSVQRRMRSSISNLTKGYYKDVIEIVDDSTTETRTIAKTGMREVPGLSSHLYLWTHLGEQKRAAVGVSRINPQEADMVCALACYLVKCGVPKTSITILTPYKGQLKLIQKQLTSTSPFKNAQLLSRDPKAVDVCRLSTVDRYQGDENDVILISLVVDKSSNTPFVKLLNRMIVLLSRARLAMYIVGNLTYFENNKSLSSHWAKTLTFLRNGGSADAAIPADQVSSLVSDAIPLCCPFHSEKIVPARTSLEVKTDFCKEICQENLSCSHACGLVCHWPSKTHNSLCSKLVPSPCTTHFNDIKCHQVYSNQDGRGRKAMPIDEAVQHYRCPEKLKVPLPCSHEVQLPCWKNSAIADGSQQLPDCMKKSPIPFVYPLCKHEKGVTCYELKNFQNNLGAVTPCNEVQEYIPICGHIKSLPCHQKTEFEAHPERFVCVEKETLLLPRCRHEVTVGCKHAKDIKRWTGIGCEEVGRVQEGFGYGPLDYPCQQKVTFIRKCGHKNANITCQQAFERAKSGVSQCHEKVDTINRFCGHPCRISCHEAQRLKDVPIPEPITKFDEGNARKLSSTLSYTRCSHVVTVHRHCGHEAKIKCHQIFGALSPCDTKIAVSSPLCGHTITVPCSDRASFEAWRPWSVALHERLNPFSLSNDKKLREGIALSKSASLDTTSDLPSNLKPLLTVCKEYVRITLPCNHEKQLPCKNLYQTLRNIDEQRCTEKIDVKLPCGHVIKQVACSDQKLWKEGMLQLECTEQCQKKCWNFENCGNCILCPCKFKGLAACGGESEWTCSSGLHKYSLSQCTRGVPSSCPGCAMASLLETVKNSDDIEPFTKLPQCFHGLKEDQITSLNCKPLAFLDDEHTMLYNLRQRIRDYNVWERPCLNPGRVRFFMKLPKKQYKNPKDFKISARILKEQTLRGVPVHLLNGANLKLVKEQTTEMSFPIHLVIGVASVAHSTAKPIPKGRGKRDEFRQFIQENSYDSVLYDDKEGLASLIVLDPDVVMLTHVVKLREKDFMALAGIEPGHIPMEPKQISFIKPDGEIQCFNISKKETSVQDQTNDITDEVNEDEDGRLDETPLQGMRVDKSAEADLLHATDIPELVADDLFSKMAFSNGETEDPFAGKRLLDRLLTQHKWPILSLLYAVEMQNFDEDVAQQSLNEYLKNVHTSKDLLHPWAILASARLEKVAWTKRRLLKYFVEEFPEGQRHLTPDEIEVADESDDEESVGGNNKETSSELLDGRSNPAANKWAKLKKEFPNETESEAMEKLLVLTGLQKVKQAAVDIYQSALHMQSLDEEIRRENAYATNYCFLGNPGTGKTTCCRLFARILHDCGLRAKEDCIELTAQKAKDDGIDDFRKSAQAAMGGVLFIDEAYDLDPVGDFKGKPIVNELLTMCENDRDKISVILAGYEDEFQKKLYDYNEGIRSRFVEIQFEDFDEEELKTIWNSMRESKKWEEEPGLCDIVVKRLMKSQGRKGFGNARDVRQYLEKSTKAGFARLGSDLSKDSMILKISDAIGEDPRKNPKLKRVLQKIDAKIGWKRVKEAVSELVELCGANYERELRGEPPHEIFLNRMMLGNPGTGKTSCAALYGELLKCLGFLSNGEVVMKTAGDFVGSVVGESQKTTISILESAKGKVLVIDEAYVLDDNLYGKQVLDTLVEKVQNSSSEDRAVMLLGYEEPMLKMIRSQNPGLARRFPKEYSFYFDDFSNQELLTIIKSSMKDQKIISSANFLQRAIEVLSVQKQQANFGNAGAVASLIKGAVQKATSRMKGSSGKIKLEASDIIAPGVTRSEKEDDPLATLDKLFRMEEIRKKLETLRNNFIVAQQEGRERPPLGHFVFSGSPGTGKTTVARALAKILFGLGLTSSDLCKETSGLDITGDFVGQTVTKVKETLKDAKGGILFIDEAYTLGEGPYGQEAVNTLVEGMTSDQYKDVVIVIAGYQQEIHQMLKTANVGFKSRFNHFFHFPDWDVDNCVTFFTKKAKKESFEIAANVEAILRDGFTKLQALAGWGNGRDVIKLWDEVLSCRSSRVIVNPETIKTISKDDASLAISTLVKGKSEPDVKPSSRSLRYPDSNSPPMKFDDMFPRNQKMNEATVLDKVAKEKSEDDVQEGEIDIGGAQNTEIPKTYERDDGVSDEDWWELCEAKEKGRRDAEEAAQLEERLKKEAEEAARKEEEARLAYEEEMKRLQEIEEEKKRLEAMREAERVEEERRRAAEEERRRREEEERKRLEEIRKKEALQEKLRCIGNCPAGYKWYKCGGGWRCSAGGHRVSDEQLQAQFAFDV